MPRRLLKRVPADPHKRRAFIVAAVVSMACFAGLIWLLVATVNKNSQQIAKRPTTEQVLKALTDERERARFACHVVEARFGILAKVVASQRPNAVTTAYFRDHPAELAVAQHQFDLTLAALQPRDCLKVYPVPTLKDVVGGGGAPPGKTKQPP